MKKIRTFFKGFAALILAVLMAWPSVASATVTNQSLAVPLYAQPGKNSFWDDIRAAGSSSVPFVVANPANGPGLRTEPIYTDALNKNQAANIRTLGYIQINYQQRPFREAFADIDAWYRNYAATRGIYIDLVKEGAAADVCYVSALYGHIKNTRPNDLVILGAGTHLSSAYEPYGDIFMNVTSDYASYQSWRALYPNFEGKIEYQNRFWHLIYGVPSENYSAAFDAARQNNAGWVFLTDKTPPTPFAATPSFWQNESSDIGALPPSTIPNRGKTSLPRGCISLSASVDTMIDTTKARQTALRSQVTVNNTSDLYDSEPTTSLQIISLPKGVALTSLAGDGWACNVAAKNCTLPAAIGARSSVARITADMQADCTYGGGDATVRLANYTGNRWDAQLPIKPPFGCEAGSPAGKINADKSGQVITLTTQSTETTPDIAPLGAAPTTPTLEPKAPPKRGLSAAKILLIMVGGVVLLGIIGACIWWFRSRQRYQIKL